jgi:histidyl-tRNA synthetase
MGPMFRHERPQRGRYRQFYQLGAEALAFAGPEVDAELILLAHQLLKNLGVSEFRVELNSLGLASERSAHRNALIAFFEKNLDILDADAQRRLYANPLRILDTKNPSMQGMVQEAPQLLRFLGDVSLKHFDKVKSLLDACEIPWKINPRLVRGLDYYSHTVFEFITDELGAQGTLCGGGRYDGLFELLGGKPTPAVGWGMGIERVLELLSIHGTKAKLPRLDAFAVIGDDHALPVAVGCIQTLRSMGVSVQMHAAIKDGSTGMKSQLKRADASGAQFALIFGSDEIARGTVTVKSLRDGIGTQVTQSLNQAAQWGTSLQSPT